MKLTTVKKMTVASLSMIVFAYGLLGLVELGVTTRYFIAIPAGAVASIGIFLFLFLVIFPLMLTALFGGAKESKSGLNTYLLSYAPWIRFLIVEGKSNDK